MYFSICNASVIFHFSFNKSFEKSFICFPPWKVDFLNLITINLQIISEARIRQHSRYYFITNISPTFLVHMLIWSTDFRDNNRKFVFLWILNTGYTLKCLKLNAVFIIFVQYIFLKRTITAIWRFTIYAGQLCSSQKLTSHIK